MLTEHAGFAVAIPPQSIFHDAVLSVRETCDIQLGVQFDESSGEPREPAAVWYGSAIRLSAVEGAWMYGVVCDRHSCEELTRLLFAMAEEDDVSLEEMADALNEVVNVAAGVFKTKRAVLDESLQIGLPTFMERVPGFGDRRNGLRAASCRLDGGSLDLHVVVYWQEGPGHES